jgi:hypothetical protein
MLLNLIPCGPYPIAGIEEELFVSIINPNKAEVPNLFVFTYPKQKIENLPNS